MKKTPLLIPCLAILVSGCAVKNTSKANLDATPNGIRVYPPLFICLWTVRKGVTT